MANRLDSENDKLLPNVIALIFIQYIVSSNINYFTFFSLWF